MAAVRASNRVSIAWKGGQAYEDTDTLVLTIHDFSLDLRVFVSGPQQGEIDWATVAKVSEKPGSTRGELRVPSPHSTTENPVLTWEHIIDSRPTSGEEDAGVFESLPNGDVTETGRMLNPATGDIEPYVETWRRLPVSGPYVVLELQEDGVIGYAGRLDYLSLGLAKVGESFAAWRENDGKRAYTFGPDAAVPALPDVLPAEWKQGDIVVHGGKQWIVRWLGTT